MNRSGPLKRSPLKKRGAKSDAWKKFRDAKLAADVDEEGLVRCQDAELGLRHCGYSVSNPDLHHIIGRDQRPDLYFSDENLVWLRRTCHELAHRSGKR